MYIGAINNSLSAVLLNNYRMHSARVADLQKKVAEGTSFLTASDKPSMVGTIETLKSKISENVLLAGMASPAKTELDSLGVLLEAATSRAVLDVQTGDEASLRDLVDTLRSMTNWASTGGDDYFTGDPANPVIYTVNHDATSASLSAAVSGTVTLAADSVVNEAGVDVDKSTLEISVNGTSKQVQINAGDYTPEELASALQAGIDSAFGAGQVTVSASGGELSLSTTSTSTSATLDLGGTIATTTGIAGTSAGEDAWTEEVQGPPGPKDMSFAGRELTFFNANDLADQLETALDAGDLAGAQTIASQGRDQMLQIQSEVGVTGSMLGEDLINRALKDELLNDQMDAITAPDPSISDDLVKEQVRMEQAAWAITAMNDTYQSQVRILLGLDEKSM